MNSLYNQLNARSIPANIKQMVQMFRGITNPQAMVQKALNENPQLKALIDASGGNPEKAFRDMAKKMNVNPDEIINMLR